MKKFELKIDGVLKANSETAILKDTIKELDNNTKNTIANQKILFLSARELETTMGKMASGIEKTSVNTDKVNKLFSSSANIMESFGLKTRFSQKQLGELGVMMGNINTLHKDNNKITEKAIKTQSDLWSLQSDQSKERRKGEAETNLWYDVFKNRVIAAVKSIDVVNLAIETYKDFTLVSKAAFKEVDEYVSQFDKTIHYSVEAMNAHNKEYIKLKEREILTAEKNKSKLMQIMLDESIALDIIYKERLKSLAQNKLINDETIFTSPVIKDNKLRDENAQTNKNSDWQIARVKEQTREKITAVGGVASSDIDDTTYVAKGNDVIVEGYGRRVAITKKYQEANKKLTKQQQEDMKNSIRQSVADEVDSENAKSEELAQLRVKDVESVKAVAEEKIEIVADVVEATSAGNAAMVENTKQSTEKQIDSWKEFQAKMQEYVNNIMTGVNAIFSATNAILGDQLNEAKEKYNQISVQYSKVVDERKQSDEKIKELEGNAQNARGEQSLVFQEQINQEMAKNQQLAQQENDLSKAKEKQEKEIAKKEKQKKKTELSQNIIQGVANTALGVTKAWGLGPILGPILAAIVGAAGAVQIGIMTKQLAKLEDGGLLRGKRHSQGGMRIEGTNIEVEGGEYVVNRESTNKNLGLVRYINSQRKELTPIDINSYFTKATHVYEPPFRRMFEAGGELPAINNTVNVDNDALVDAIKSIKFSPRVAVSDILRVQDEMTSVDGWAGV